MLLSMEPNVKPTTQFLIPTLSTTRVVITYSNTIEICVSHVFMVEPRFYMTYLRSQWGPDFFVIRLELFFIFLTDCRMNQCSNRYFILSTIIKQDSNNECGLFSSCRNYFQFKIQRSVIWIDMISSHSSNCFWKTEICYATMYSKGIH